METSLSNPGPRKPLPKRWLWVIFGIVPSLLAVIFYFNRFSPAAREARAFVREMPADQIREVRIEPYTVMSLTDRVVVIRDREKISRIAAAFRGMDLVSPNHPHARWVSYIRFRLVDREYGGQIESTDNQGGLFWMGSNVQGGWNYGCYRNDALGPLFEQLVAEEKARP